MEKKKIVFFISSMVKAGAQRVVMNLTLYYRELGYQVVLVTPYQDKDEYEVPTDVQRILSDLTEEEKSNSRIKNFLKRLQKLRRIWKEVKPEFILSFMGKTNFMALASSRGLRIPVFVSVRSAPEREYYSKAMRFLSKTLFCLANGIILQTEDARAYFPKRMQKKTVILPNPINPLFMKDRWDGERKQEIVTVGRIDKNKNHQMILQAFSRIHQEYPEMKVVLYGDGPEKENLENLAMKLELQDKVFFPGSMNQMQDRIDKSRIFVLSSKVEGMPNVLLEAMSLGLACISTDCPCGGPRTMIKDHENGILIPVDDVDALETALREILDTPELEERLGRNASLVGKELSPEKVNRMWKEYIEKNRGCQ